MAVMLGDKDPSAFAFGDNDVSALYLGDDLVWSASPVPRAYREVNHLYTEGSGYFKILNYDDYDYSEWEFEIDCEFSEGQMFGVSLGYEWGVDIRNGNYYAKLYEGISPVDTGIPAGERCIFRISKKDNLLSITPYNELYSEFVIDSGDVSKIYSPNSVLVGSAYDYWNAVDGYHNGVGKIYHYKAWYKDKYHSEQELLLRKDCYPCYRKADKETGLFDIVTGSFITNAKSNVTKMLYPGEKLPDVAEWEDLPEGYTPLFYLESSGTQYIDLGERSVGRLNGVMIKCKHTHTGNYSVFGKYQRLNLTGRSGDDRFYDPGANYHTVRSGPSLTNLYNLSLRMGILRHYDGSLVQLESWNPDTRSEWNTSMYLFGRNNNNTLDDAGGTVRIYNFMLAQLNTSGVGDKVYEVKYNMIPAKRTSDGVVGMYDVVSDEFFTNAGTGSFVYVGLDDITPVEYVETMGGVKAVITGIPTDVNDVRIETDAQILSGAQYDDGIPFFFRDNQNAFVATPLDPADGTDYDNGHYRIRIGKNASDSVITDIPFDERCTFIFDRLNNRISAIPLNEEYNAWTWGSLTNMIGWSSRFGVGGSTNGDSNNFGNGNGVRERIYGIKVYKNGDIIMNWLPVRLINGDTVLFDVERGISVRAEAYYQSYSWSSEDVYNTAGGFVEPGLLDKPTLPEEYESIEYLQANNGPWIITPQAGSINNLMILAKWEKDANAGHISGKGVPSDAVLFDSYNNYYSMYQFSPMRSSQPWLSIGGAPNGGRVYEYWNQFMATACTCHTKYKRVSMYREEGLNPRDGSYHNYNLGLFASNNNGSPYGENAIKRLWYYRIFRYDHAMTAHNERGYYKLLDCWPARRKSDGELGMYDFVSNTFLTNAGVGAFTAPQDPNEYCNISDWTLNMQPTQFSNVYDAETNTNTLTYVGTGGNERLYIPITIMANHTATLKMKFCSPTGFNVMYGSDTEYIGIVSSNPASDSNDFNSIYNSSTYKARTAVSNEASEEFTDLEVTLTPSGSVAAYFVIDLGYVEDGVTTVFKFKDVETHVS